MPNLCDQCLYLHSGLRFKTKCLNENDVERGYHLENTLNVDLVL